MGENLGWPGKACCRQLLTIQEETYRASGPMRQLSRPITRIWTKQIHPENMLPSADGITIDYQYHQEQGVV
eukprot:scaffold165968_cov39-Prasinocladus_malaysianus.AAC.3